MAQSLVLSVDVCPGLGIPPLQTNIWLSFLRPILAQDRPGNIFFSGFLKSLKLFFRRFVLIASGTEIFWRVSLKFELFLATSRFHCHWSEKRIFISQPTTTKQIVDTRHQYSHVETESEHPRAFQHTKGDKTSQITKYGTQKIFVHGGAPTGSRSSSSRRGWRVAMVRALSQWVLLACLPSPSASASASRSRAALEDSSPAGPLAELGAVPQHHY